MKFGKYIWADELDVIEQFRDKDDKKGGGLTIMWKKSVGIEIKKNKEQHQDVLHVTVKVHGYSFEMILLYISVSDKERNLQIKEKVENILKEKEENPVLLLGDFNGHVGFLGEQKLDINGKIILEWLDKYDLTMLNDVCECEGTYTWSVNNLKSVIDYMFINKRLNEKFLNLKIDESKNIFDLSDHNLIIANFQVEVNTGSIYKNMKWSKKEYLKINEETLKTFTREMEKELLINKAESIEEIEDRMKKLADKSMKRILKIREDTTNVNIKEPIWVNNSIRNEIKKRRLYNRQKRITNEDNTREEMEVRYREQKTKVQIMVKEAKENHERMLTEELRMDKNNNKLWDIIKRLKGNSKSIKEVYLYDGEGEKLASDKSKEVFINYWTSIYKKHENKINEIWNEERKMNYILEYEAQEQSNMILEDGIIAPDYMEEHMNMLCKVNKRIRNMEYPKITIQEVTKYLKNLKKKKAPGQN